jgi:hypothetical protein
MKMYRERSPQDIYNSNRSFYRFGLFLIVLTLLFGVWGLLEVFPGWLKLLFLLHLAGAALQIKIATAYKGPDSWFFERFLPQPWKVKVRAYRRREMIGRELIALKKFQRHFDEYDRTRSLQKASFIRRNWSRLQKVVDGQKVFNQPVQEDEEWPSEIAA